MEGYLNNKDKKSCCGCGACKNICPKGAIEIVKDEEGFYYPVVDEKKCISCGLCHKVCQYENEVDKHKEEKYVFGGYHNDWQVRESSTSGGAFSAIVDAFCDKDYVIFGAETKKLKVFHSYVEDKNQIRKYRKSKYSQSDIGNTYKEAKEFLQKGKKVLFSGTPCQIAGLNKYLMNTDTKNLLTVEVVCEGVPSPLYIEKLDKHFYDKYKSHIASVDYRYKDSKRKGRAKWDFEVMRIVLENGKVLKKDRWFNPYWRLWLDHLMSRPSCYHCPYTTSDRVSDITLGDLWGVHLYCPELYGHNGGASLMIANTKKGKKIIKEAEKKMYGHELKFDDALKYQGPMRKCIAYNEKREEFIKDLQDKDLTYKDIVKKWYKSPSIKLLWSKYVWGNRQIVFCYNLKRKKEQK
jgi:coenzyme F420-reducing hydrogenase beta subunit